MSTSKKNLKKASISLGKLKRDLKNDENLQDAWARDPAEIFVQYGIASNKEDVNVKEVPGSECGCGCFLGIEFQYEWSDYAPAALETLD